MQTTYEVVCPYCGQAQFIFLDISVRHQQYVEDCQVCCRPLELSVTVVGEDEILVDVRMSDE